MRFSTLPLGVLLLAGTAVPAFAQDTDPPAPITVSGNVTLTSDYRFRGATQSDEGPAAQATLTIAHESGFYAGTFVSTIDGSGDTPALTGYGDVEIDLFAGYSTELGGGIGVDVGMLYYWYADAASGLDTDFFEPYAALTYSLGPVDAKLGVAYAWGGQDGLDFTASNDDSLYIYLDAKTAIPGTPLSLNAHVGRSKGSLGLLNPGTDDEYWDWAAGVEWAGGPIAGGVKYIDTDITNTGRFAQRLGRGSTVLGYVSFAF